MAATFITRLRNFVSDKNNSIPITSQYVDNELNQILTSLNSKVLAQASSPSSPTTGDTWIDTSASPPQVKVYTGSAWTVASSGGTFPKTVLLMGA